MESALNFSSINRRAYPLIADDIESRKVELAVPEGITELQNSALRTAVLNAAERGVTINVTYVQ